jgi:uncharacterized protein
MGKFLIWVIVAAGAWFAWKFYQTSQRRIEQSRRAAPGADEPARPDAAASSPERMQACAHCGVHLPASESVSDADGRPFCSAAHREAAKRSS